jgi:hypothetical protein
MRTRELGKAFVLLVVGCAIIALALFTWMLRSEPGQPGKPQHDMPPGQSVSAISVNEKTPIHHDVGPTESESSGRFDIGVPISPSTRAIQTDTAKADGPAPASITYRYEATTLREPEFPNSEPPGAVGGSTSSAALIPRTQGFTLRADSKGCATCASSMSRRLAIPPECVYVSHTVTQIHREPYMPVEQTYDSSTEYRVTPFADTNGRLEGFTLSVWARKKELSAAQSFIEMQLTVAMDCPAE